jgi:hypothetical protein
MRRLFSALLLVALAFPATSHAFVISKMKNAPKDPLAYRHAGRKKNEPNPPGKEKYVLRNEQRRKDVVTLANAFYNYRTDHQSENVPGLTEKPVEICRTKATSCKDLLDVRKELEPYLATLPVDPGTSADRNGTGYFVYEDWKNRIFITAPGAEMGWTITKMH